MRTQIGPATKLRRASEHFLNGKPVYIERDRQDGTILISDSKLLRPEDNYWIINKSDLKEQPKFNTSISAAPKKPTSDDKQAKADLNSFFDSIGDKVTYNCMNCRKPLYAFNKPAKRAVSCHILPKKPDCFPELAKDPDNIVFMGVVVFGSSCDDHSMWDSSVERRKKMPIYDYVIKRYYEKLRPKLSTAKQVLADDYLGITIKSQNLTKDLQEAKS